MTNPNDRTIETVINRTPRHQECFRHCGSCGLRGVRHRQDRDSFILALALQNGLDAFTTAGVATEEVKTQCQAKVAEAGPSGFDAWEVASACRSCIQAVEIVSRHRGDPDVMVFDVPKSVPQTGPMRLERKL